MLLVLKGNSYYYIVGGFKMRSSKGTKRVKLTKKERIIADLQHVLYRRFANYPILEDYYTSICTDSCREGLNFIVAAFPDFEFEYSTSAEHTICITKIPFQIIDELYTGPTIMTDTIISRYYQEFNTIIEANRDISREEVCRYLGLTTNGYATLILLQRFISRMDLKLEFNIHTPIRKKIAKYDYYISWQQIEGAIGVYTVTFAGKYSQEEIKEAVQELARFGGKIDPDIQKLVFVDCPLELIGI